MKVKFIAPEKTREFKYGQILEAKRYRGVQFSNPLLIIKDKWGENYGYPAAWFEVIEEDDESQG